MQAEPKKDGRPTRTSVDLAAYPELTVVYLGFRVASWRSLLALVGIGRRLEAINRDRPDGLLCHERIVYGLNHIGMRQYWRDLEALEAFTRSDPHKTWWADFTRNMKGAGFWHEAYRRSGGMEAVYLDMPKPIGFASFAAAKTPVGPFMSSRERLAA